MKIYFFDLTQVQVVVSSMFQRDMKGKCEKAFGKIQKTDSFTLIYSQDESACPKIISNHDHVARMYG